MEGFGRCARDILGVGRTRDIRVFGDFPLEPLLDRTLCHWRSSDDGPLSADLLSGPADAGERPPIHLLVNRRLRFLHPVALPCHAARASTGSRSRCP